MSCPFAGFLLARSDGKRFDRAQGQGTGWSFGEAIGQCHVLPPPPMMPAIPPFLQPQKHKTRILHFLQKSPLVTDMTMPVKQQWMTIGHVPYDPKKSDHIIPTQRRPNCSFALLQCFEFVEAKCLEQSGSSIKIIHSTSQSLFSVTCLTVNRFSFSFEEEIWGRKVQQLS